MFDLLPGRNTKVWDKVQVKERSPFIHICYPAHTHQSILQACPLTQNQNFSLKVKAAEFQQWQELGASHSTGAIQSTTGDISTFLSGPVSDCLCRQRLNSNCWQRCSSGVWLFVTLPRDCPPGCSWMLCVFLLDTKHSPPSSLSLQVLHLYHS